MVRKARRKNRFIHYNMKRINKILRQRYINKRLREIRHSNRNHRYYSYDTVVEVLKSATEKIPQLEKFEGIPVHPNEKL